MTVETKVKPVNYTPDMVAKMYDMYLAIRDGNQEERDAGVEAICAAVDREKKSVVSKLSRMTLAGTDIQLYIPKAKVSTVTGEAAKKKDALGVELAGLVNPVLPAEVEGIKVARINAENVAKLNKTDIQGLILFARMYDNLANPQEVEETETAE
jgi:hypothetical protein